MLFFAFLRLVVEDEGDGEFGADQLAIAAGQAFGFFFDSGQPVALVVELGAHVQDLARAIFRAKTAALAPDFIYMDVTERPSVGVMVKRNTPQLHVR